ncbi:VIT family protein [Gulosibacter macacae]|uniref:VIT family protein n=1 Tax=Gulosibacter macacae TaxID=2488791 RepID=A0A3P3W2N8_9MICO|nr:VIT family protein [Gulosibacter macacae]RRJ88638.1 VIT family protein [Gulosibacter macacae]
MTNPAVEPLHPVNDVHASNHGQRLNWLRAGVLGANDGIVSTSALVVGVAAATPEFQPLLIAGTAALLAGALSMGVGEYVSVSTQRDTEKALIAKETWELEHMPEQELEELTQLYMAKGLRRETAEEVARELTAKDALGAHLETELHMDAEELTNPWVAAGASALAFTVGAILPLLAVLFVPGAMKIPATAFVVLIALVITGWLSAKLGGARVGPAVIRVVLGGMLALAITFGIGAWLGTGVA